jgi:cytochrome c oxidase subunit 2
MILTPTKRFISHVNSLFVLFAAALTAIPALAEEDSVVGMARPWQLNFQAPQSPVMDKLYDMHTALLWIITAVSVFVLGLTIYIALKFNRKANPVASTTTHNTMLEVVWTTIPILILVAIAIPSVRTHYFMEKEPEEGFTIKVTGHQWYWSYEYPDHGNFGFDSYMLSDADAEKAGEPRLLAVDNRVVVPVNTPIRVLLTGADVIHAWAMPALGVKRDAVPGRLNATWFEANKEGIYYGQCSELCGVKHGFMPIALEVVSQEKFDAWIAVKQKEAGIQPPSAEPTVETTAKPTQEAQKAVEKSAEKKELVKESTSPDASQKPEI